MPGPTLQMLVSAGMAWALMSGSCFPGPEPERLTEGEGSGRGGEAA